MDDREKMRNALSGMLTLLSSTISFVTVARSALRQTGRSDGEQCSVRNGAVVLLVMACGTAPVALLAQRCPGFFGTNRVDLAAEVVTHATDDSTEVPD